MQVSTGGDAHVVYLQQQQGGCQPHKLADSMDALIIFQKWGAHTIG